MLSIGQIAIIALAGYGLPHQDTIQHADGSWWIEAGASRQEAAKVTRVDWGPYEYVEPVTGLRVSADKATGSSMPIRMVVHFAFDSARIDPAAVNQISELSAVFNNFEIDGHTDRIGPMQYNQRLSRRRADAVARVLRRTGVHVVVHAYGETQPTCRTGTPACRARNRRAVIRAEDRK